jgi:CheY-like chemotaxis protein
MCKLLVIDDNHMEHMILQTLLTHYKLFEDNNHSEDGKLSLDFLKKNRADEKSLPDLILLDLYMPNFSGWDFLNRFNRIYRTFKKKLTLLLLQHQLIPTIC